MEGLDVWRQTRSLSLRCQITLFSVKINFARQRKRKEGVKMKPRPDLVMVLARLSSWMVILLLGTVIDLSVLARVTFPSDESLRVDLPEWQPADRATRQAQWKHSRPKYGHNRRGQYHHHPLTLNTFLRHGVHGQVPGVPADVALPVPGAEQWP